MSFILLHGGTHNFPWTFVSRKNQHYKSLNMPPVATYIHKYLLTNMLIWYRQSKRQAVERGSRDGNVPQGLGVQVASKERYSLAFCSLRSHGASFRSVVPGPKNALGGPAKRQYQRQQGPVKTDTIRFSSEFKYPHGEPYSKTGHFVEISFEVNAYSKGLGPYLLEDLPLPYHLTVLNKIHAWQVYTIPHSW